MPNLLPALPNQAIQTWRQLLNIFEEKETPAGRILTDTQIQIIDIIAKRAFPRTQLIMPTQYGKSLCVSLGVLLRITHYKEKWAIVAPTQEKARIIMDYIIEHVFDDVLFEDLLEYHDTKEKLKQHRNKSRLSFRGAGEVRVYSADAGNTKQVRKALMGFGAANVILDEAAQIPDELYATVKRMVGGSAADSFILEIGNPSFRNHFHKSWFGTRYVKVFKDCWMALEEGRYTRDYLEEMEEQPGFDWMYACQFPDADQVLANGYRRLVSDLVINDAMQKVMPPLNYKLDEDGQPLLNKWGYKIINDSPILGIDVAGGGNNKTKLVVRLPKHNIVLVARTSDSEDLEAVADLAEEVIREYTVDDWHTVIDAGGVGHGLPAIMLRRGYMVQGVLFGSSTDDEAKRKIPKSMLNMRANMYWEARKWLIKDKGKMLDDEGFEEVRLIMYRQNSSLKIQIEPKAELIKRKAEEGEKVESPDTADAFVLTFVDTSAIIDEEDIMGD